MYLKYCFYGVIEFLNANHDMMKKVSMKIRQLKQYLF